MIFLRYFLLLNSTIFIISHLLTFAWNAEVEKNLISKCKWLLTSGYKYQHFFYIPHTNESDGEILLKFYVKTKSDAHILFSTNPTPADNEPVYEIVLGGGRNTFCEIRRLQCNEPQTTVTDINLLSANEWKGFWIRIAKNGFIQVGKEKDDLPFLIWNDPNPLYVTYFSFSTWVEIVGEWAFDCSIDKNTEVEEVDLTTTEKLKRDVFHNYDFYPMSMNTMISKLDIRLKIKSWYVNLDVGRNTLILIGSASLIWRDENLTWDPKSYEDIAELNIGSSLTWRPEIVILNSATPHISPFYNSDTIIKSDGFVYWMPMIKIKTKCNIRLENWPWDSHFCKIELGTLSQNGNFILDQKDLLVSWPKFTMEWQVKDVKSYLKIIEKSSNLQFSNYETEVTHKLESQVLIIEIILQRNVSFYDYSLCFMFVAVCFLILSTFFVSSASALRIKINALSQLLASAFLFITVECVPNYFTHTPLLISGFIFVFVISTIACIESIFLIRISRKVHLNDPPNVFNRCINKKIFSLLLFLSYDEEEELFKYYELEERKDDSSSPDNIQIDEIHSELVLEKVQKNWIKLITAIDRMFLLVFSTIVVFLVSYFMIRSNKNE